MNRIVFSQIGLIHLIAAVASLITGAFVIAATKGTRLHKTVGYVYLVSMIVTVITALLIYRLFGGFGVFHVAAIVSAVTLAGGMLPAILRRPKTTWLEWHYSFMFWSVVGLYAAFVSEIFTRVPGLRFFTLVGVGTGIVMLIGGLSFRVYKNKWQKLAKVYN